MRLLCRRPKSLASGPMFQDTQRPVKPRHQHLRPKPRDQEIRSQRCNSDSLQASKRSKTCVSCFAFFFFPLCGQSTVTFWLPSYRSAGAGAENRPRSRGRGPAGDGGEGRFEAERPALIGRPENGGGGKGVAKKGSQALGNSRHTESNHFESRVFGYFQSNPY